MSAKGRGRKTVGKSAKRKGRGSTAVASPATGAPNAELEKVMESVRTKLVSSGETSALAHFDIGRSIIAVKQNPEKYGLEPRANVVKHFQERLPFAKDTLYNNVRVAETWSEKELKEVLSAESPSKGRLTIAHFVEAARLKGEAADRNALLNEALANDWSTRDLRKIVRERMKKTKVASFAREIRAMVKATKKAITTATALHTLLAADQGGNSSDVAPLLDEAVKLQRDLGEVCAQNVVALNEKRARCDASARNVAAVSGDNVVPLTAILGASTPTASDGLVEGGA